MAKCSSRKPIRRFRNGRAPRGALALLCLLGLASCGGGGGGGSDNDVVPNNVVADFTASCDLAGGTCPSDSVVIQEQVASGDTVTVQPVLNRLNETIAFADLLIKFDPAVAEYLGFSPGTALGNGNQCPTPSSGGQCILVTETGPGELVVSLLADSDGASISSAQSLVTLSFKALQVGATNITFLQPNNLNGSALYNTQQAIILNTNWEGGILSGS